MTPYVGCMLVASGMLAHFGVDARPLPPHAAPTKAGRALPTIGRADPKR